MQLRLFTVFTISMFPVCQLLLYKASPIYEMLMKCADVCLYCFVDWMNSGRPLVLLLLLCKRELHAAASASISTASIRYGALLLKWKTNQTSSKISESHSAAGVNAWCQRGIGPWFLISSWIRNERRQCDTRMSQSPSFFFFFLKIWDNPSWGLRLWSFKQTWFCPRAACASYHEMSRIRGWAD